MKNQTQSDNYNEARLEIFSTMMKLYGGYYEPKSARDKELADDLYKIHLKHQNKQENNGSIR